MQTYLKKTLFVITGLVIIGASFFWAKSHIADASSVSGRVFGDWKILCSKNTKKDEICFLTQQVTTTKDDKVQVLATYQIGYFGKPKLLQMIQILPLGINLPAGTSIISNDKLLALGKFTTCTSVGCEAISTISGEDLQTILSNSNNFLGIINGLGKQINLPFSTNGLKEGIEALK